MASSGNPDAVDWRGRDLEGSWRDDGLMRENNPGSAKGIYVLHHEFNPIYAGEALADSSGIGKRLADHLTDRLVARWDMFSWDSLSKTNKTSPAVALATGVTCQ